MHSSPSSARTSSDRRSCPRGPGLGLLLPLHSWRTIPEVRAESRAPPGPARDPRAEKGRAWRAGERRERAARDSRTGCDGAAGARPPAGQKRGLPGRKDPRRRGHFRGRSRLLED